VPGAGLDKVRFLLARHWARDAIDIGPCGHVRGESKLDDWPRDQPLLRTLLV
jgi:hypothetical protein